MTRIHHAGRYLAESVEMDLYSAATIRRVAKWTPPASQIGPEEESQKERIEIEIGSIGDPFNLATRKRCLTTTLLLYMVAVHPVKGS
ncbi:MAG: hypothetical protein P4L43_18150 [Syntrophobacteraceae bacterium]|nr:hypothetical protein [Syntrophobacteraceae bacterium]